MSFCHLKKITLLYVISGVVFLKYIQITSRKNVESAVRQLEREKALLQHKNTEYQRKAEHEADKKRNLENEGMLNCA